MHEIKLLQNEGRCKLDDLKLEKKKREKDKGMALKAKTNLEIFSIDLNP